MEGLSIASIEESVQILHSAQTVAVLGIKPASRIEEAAHWVPKMMQEVGYQIIPVPTRYPEEQHILGQPIVRGLRQLPNNLDILNIFRKPADFMAHLDDILAIHPKVVWFQSGLFHEEGALRLQEAGIVVVHDCIACRRASIKPSTKPLEGQRQA